MGAESSSTAVAVLAVIFAAVVLVAVVFTTVVLVAVVFATVIFVAIVFVVDVAFLLPPAGAATVAAAAAGIAGALRDAAAVIVLVIAGGSLAVSEALACALVLVTLFRVMTVPVVAVDSTLWLLGIRDGPAATAPRLRVSAREGGGGGMAAVSRAEEIPISTSSFAVDATFLAVAARVRLTRSTPLARVLVATVAAAIAVFVSSFVDAPRWPNGATCSRIGE